MVIELGDAARIDVTDRPAVDAAGRRLQAGDLVDVPAVGVQDGGDRLAQRPALRPDDDDFGQPGTLVRDVFNDAERDALVEQVAGSLLGGVREPVLGRALQYWKSIDADVGQRIEAKVKAGAAPRPAEGMGEG